MRHEGGYIKMTNTFERVCIGKHNIYYDHYSFLKCTGGASLVVQCLRYHTYIAGDTGLIMEGDGWRDGDGD